MKQNTSCPIISFEHIFQKQPWDDESKSSKQSSSYIVLSTRSSNWILSPIFGVNIRNSLEPPPSLSQHHLPLFSNFLSLPWFSCLHLVSPLPGLIGVEQFMMIWWAWGKQIIKNQAIQLVETKYVLFICVFCWWTCVKPKVCSSYLKTEGMLCVI